MVPLTPRFSGEGTESALKADVMHYIVFFFFTCVFLIELAKIIDNEKIKPHNDKLNR